jgi:putative transposase
MAVVLQPWQILVAALAGWINRQQDAVIEYLHEENRVLKQQLGTTRLRLSDDQRRRLAVRGKAIGRSALTEVASIVTPDTILRWHRRLIEPAGRDESALGAVECIQRLGGMLRFYHRAAA